MTDLEYSELAKQAMNIHEYDKAMAHLDKMNNVAMAVRMQFLVIEHERGYLNQ